MADAPPQGSEETEENVRVVVVPPPVQWGVGIPNIPGAKEKVVVLALVQGGWRTEVMLSGNDAITLGAQLRTNGKQANSGITVARSAILGADGQPIAVAADDDDEDDEA